MITEAHVWRALVRFISRCSRVYHSYSGILTFLKQTPALLHVSWFLDVCLLLHWTKA